jgi:hypothetical protein
MSFFFNLEQESFKHGWWMTFFRVGADRLRVDGHTENVRVDVEMYR